MRRIIHLLTGLARGGCEGNALRFVENTPGFHHHLVVLGASGPMEQDFKKAGATVDYLPLEKSPWGLSQRIRECVLPHNPAGVIVWHGMVMLPQILRGLRGSPFNILVHGGNPAHGMPLRVDLRYYLLEKLLGQRAEATYVCCSQHVADSFQESLYLRRFRSVVVPNGVHSPSVPLHKPREIRPGHAVTLGMVARLDSIKDHATLLRAFAALLKEWPEARLELVGDGAERQRLETMADELQVAQRVVFHGTLSDVYETMTRWDLFAYATTIQEGLGNALAEAMMLGLPCVATNVKPIQELAGTPSCVELVQPASPEAMTQGILRLLHSFELREKLSSSAHGRAKKELSAEVYAQRYVGLLSA